MPSWVFIILDLLSCNCDHIEFMFCCVFIVLQQLHNNTKHKAEGYCTFMPLLTFSRTKPNIR